MLDKYDDWSWHAGGDFPEDLPSEAGATHAGMFVAWAVYSGLAGEIQKLEKLRQRTITPGEFFLEGCDGKLTRGDFNDEGNAFTQDYYGPAEGFWADYEATIGDGLQGRNIYRVKDTWENYERLRPVLDQRLAEWRANARNHPTSRPSTPALKRGWWAKILERLRLG